MTNSDRIRQALNLIIDRMATDLDRDGTLSGVTFDLRFNPRNGLPADVHVTRHNREELPGRARVPA